MKKFMKKAGLIFCLLLLIFIFTKLNYSEVSALSQEEILSQCEVVDSGNCGGIGEEVVWKLFSNGTLVISGEGSVKYYDYMDGDKSPFHNNLDIKSIVVKSGVESIGSGAFYGCKSVKSVRIEEGVKSIGENILSNSSTVVSVILPSTLTSIGIDNYSLSKAPSIFFTGSKEQWDKIEGINKFENENVYYNTLFDDELAYQIVDDHAKLVGVDVSLCEEKLVLPETVNGYPLTEISDYAFNKVVNVKHLVISKSVTTLGVGAFFNFLSLESIDLPDSITYLPASAFERCYKLKEAILPDSIVEFKTKIKDLYGSEYDSGFGYTFAYCDSLENVKLPNNLSVLPAYAFYHCDSLKKITIPDSVTTFIEGFTAELVGYNPIEIEIHNFGSSVFSHCKNLETVVLSKNLESLTDYSFKGCISLKSIYIPESVKLVESETFKNCTALERIVFGVETVTQEVMSLSDIGDSSAEIENLCVDSSAFENCTSLKYVTIDRMITKIEEKAFYACNKISDVYYNGNEQDWQNIDIGAQNENLLGARIHYNSQVGFVHNMEETIVKPATCEENGKANYICACGATFTGEFSALGHKYSATYTVDKEATCTTAGSKSQHCTRKGCKQITNATQIEMLPHSYISKVITASTCKEKGTKTYTCSSCGDAYTEPMNKLPHTYKVAITKATLTNNGKTVEKCSCGAVKSGSEKTVYYPKTITLSATSYTYDGKVKTPTVTVKDSKGNTLTKDTDYTVKYEDGRKNPGKYTVTITFKGKYEGTKTLTFTIAPKATSKISAVTSTSAIKLTWKKVTGADGYRIYQYNTKTKKWDTVKTITSGTTVSYKLKDLKAGTKYKFRVKAYTKDDGTIWGENSATFETATKCKTPTLKVTSKNGKAVLNWSNVSGESGYQVYYSTKKDGEYKKVKNYSADTLKGTKSNLTSGKTYYFKVRAYTKTDSGVVYSSWSSVKAVKIK